jgi:hypothetical protein
VHYHPSNRSVDIVHIGWDWASEAHDVTVIDDDGDIVDRWAPAHDEAGIVVSIGRLAGHGDPADLPVAIEATHSVVIDRLLAAGHPVVPIHPNAFHAARPRWSASKAKSDPGGIGCAGSSRSALRPLNCKPSPGPVTI